MRLVMGGESLEGPLTGIGQYTYHLAKGMLASPDIEEFKFLSHGRLREPSAIMAGCGGNADSEATENQKPSRLNAALGRTRSIAAQSKTAVALYERLMPRLERHALRHYGTADVYHSPNYNRSEGSVMTDHIGEVGQTGPLFIRVDKVFHKEEESVSVCQDRKGRRITVTGVPLIEGTFVHGNFRILGHNSYKGVHETEVKLLALLKRVEYG